MSALAFFLAALILVFYFRNLRFAFSSLVPCLSGMALVVLTSMLFSFDLSFVSLIGAIVVFGLSLDYGIFATDHFRFSREDSSVWTALVFSATTTTVGFLPLVFCGHPVLFDLGFVLVVGTCGTLLGTFFVVPGFLRRAVR